MSGRRREERGERGGRSKEKEEGEEGGRRGRRKTYVATGLLLNHDYPINKETRLERVLKRKAKEVWEGQGERRKEARGMQRRG
jgi:hypothetical protein